MLVVPYRSVTEPATYPLRHHFFSLRSAARSPFSRSSSFSSSLAFSCSGTMGRLASAMAASRSRTRPEVSALDGGSAGDVSVVVVLIYPVTIVAAETCGCKARFPLGCINVLWVGVFCAAVRPVWPGPLCLVQRARGACILRRRDVCADASRSAETQSACFVGGRDKARGGRMAETTVRRSSKTGSWNLFARRRVCYRGVCSRPDKGDGRGSFSLRQSAPATMLAAPEQGVGGTADGRVQHLQAAT